MPSVSCWVAVYRDERTHRKSVGLSKPRKVNSTPASGSRTWSGLFRQQQQTVCWEQVGLYHLRGKRLQSVATISILEDHPHNPDWRHRLALVKHDIHLAGRCAPGCSTCMHQPRPLEPRSQPSLSLDEPHSPLWFHARAFFLP